MQLPVPSGLVNPIALATALLIIPVILLYLLKPKPKIVKFPTVMFIKRIEETKRFSSLLNKFIRDPLLLIQMLMIILLAMAIANPYAIMEKQSMEDEAIAIVLDSSASMQSTDVNPNRFAAAVGKARDIVKNTGEGSKVSLILAENIPITVLENGGPKKALEVLDKVMCSDTTTNTPDALMLAKDLLSQSKLKKKVYLLSDFSTTEGDLTANRRILALNGISVYFIKTNEEGNNLALVDMEARRASMNKNSMYLTYTINNYDNVEHEVTHKVYVNNMLVSMQTTMLKPESDELFYLNASITQDRQVVKVELLGGGMLALDDTAYSVIPQMKTYKTMLLSLENRDKFVAYAIDSQLNNRLRVVEPPVIPSLGDFDCIVIGNIKKNSILPGTFRDIKNSVSSGKSMIVLASPDAVSIDDPNFQELMPVKLMERVGFEKNARVVSNHEILNDVSLENIVLRKYYNAKKKENATVIAETEGSPLIAYWSYGRGKVAYVGINPANEWSNFQYSSSFPIFWSQLIEYVNTGEEITKTLNTKTGNYLVLEREVGVTNPNGETTKTKSLFLDKQGVYTVKTEDSEVLITANLINEDESDIKTSFQSEEVTEGI
ncbi:MAG: VWA domain-containing protein, partial [Candidatus Altiarchaeales archaeon]|nr:VWA domain-containing protein [Candidatus Altiarchaeales archaeon]